MGHAGEMISDYCRNNLNWWHITVSLKLMIRTYLAPVCVISFISHY